MNATVWIINQYNSKPEHGHLNRHYYFGKYLKQANYNPILFLGSSPHNTDIQLVSGRERYKIDETDGFKIVFIKAVNYGKSKIKRVFSMFQYCFNILLKSKKFDKPDIIYGSSPHPLNCILALHLAKKYNVPCICEVRDLWPVSIVEILGVSNKNLIIRMLYSLEKWIYKKADILIFTMEGGKDYIINNNWESVIDLKKVHHINNGIDLKQFDYEQQHFQIQDADLDNKDGLNLIYAGSIRKANNIMNLCEIGKILKSQSVDNVKILVYGEGPDRQLLEQEVNHCQLDNLKIKGYIEKKYIPYILSKGRNVNCLNYFKTDLAKYGGSQNKLFDYFASGKPVISNVKFGYDLIERYEAGFTSENGNLQTIVEKLILYTDKNNGEYDQYSKNARKAAIDFDFQVLTDELIKIIEEASRGYRCGKKYN